MAVDCVNNCNAVTKNGTPYKKTNKGKIICGTLGAIGMIPIPDKIGMKLPKGILRDSFISASKIPLKKQLLVSGLIGLAMFGIGALIDKCVNNKRANRADVEAGKAILG